MLELDAKADDAVVVDVVVVVALVVAVVLVQAAALRFQNMSLRIQPCTQY